MSRFTDHLGLTLLEDDNGRPLMRAGRCQWLLSASLTYDVGAEGSGETITVPAAFVTDLASIPAPARNIFPPDGPWAKAAVIHDFLYATQGTGLRGGKRWIIGRPFYTRQEADGVLREAMAVLGVPAWKRSAIWLAVRMFGGAGWGS